MYQFRDQAFIQILHIWQSSSKKVFNFYSCDAVVLSRDTNPLPKLTTCNVSYYVCCPFTSTIHTDLRFVKRCQKFGSFIIEKSTHNIHISILHKNIYFASFLIIHPLSHIAAPEICSSYISYFFLFEINFIFCFYYCSLNYV